MPRKWGQKVIIQSVRRVDSVSFHRAIDFPFTQFDGRKKKETFRNWNIRNFTADQLPSGNGIENEVVWKKEKKTKWDIWNGGFHLVFLFVDRRKVSLWIEMKTITGRFWNRWNSNALRNEGWKEICLNWIVLCISDRKNRRTEDWQLQHLRTDVPSGTHNRWAVGTMRWMQMHRDRRQLREPQVLINADLRRCVSDLPRFFQHSVESIQ